MKLVERNPKRTVLVGVDIQNDFITGSLAVNDGEAVVSPINELAQRVRESHLGRVAFTRDWHPATTPHFDTWPVHCVQDTYGAAFAPGLTIEPSDTIISKGMGQTDGYSGIEGVADDGETLESIIAPRHNKPVAVLVGGLATDYCVAATAKDIRHAFAARYNVEVYAVRDAMRAVNLQPDDEEKAVQSMAEAGVHIIDLAQAFDLIDSKRLER